MTSQMPDPEEVKRYFLEEYDNKIEEVNFSTNLLKVKLVLKDDINISLAIETYCFLKTHKLTNLHMTYIDKAEALCIYFEIDQNLGRMFSKLLPDERTETIRRLF